MKRYYFISEDLDDLVLVEKQLERAGISSPQVHVLSENDEGLWQHHLHEVNSLMKRDVVHSWQVGATIGVAVAAIVLLVAYFSGVTQTAAGWIPFIFLAIIAFGFCVWEGGLFGLRKPNVHFRRFEKELEKGKHILFIELSPEQGAAARSVIKQHPNLAAIGSGQSAPEWFIGWRKKWRHFVEVMP